jgi:hypothetical protein
MLARLIVFAVIMAILWFGWRAIRRGFADYFDSADKRARERHRLEAKRGDVVDLERDPETGVFRPGDPGRSGSGAPKDKPGN